MQGIRSELAGQRFGRLVVRSYAGNDRDRRARWECICDCGTPKVVSGKYLRRGLTRSCGCFRSDQLRAKVTTHSMAHTPTYGSWASMLSRCSNPNQQAYAKYGAIGVQVCERWKTFANFLADMGKRPDGHTLDRINPFKGYEPSNCRWSTAKEQSLNRRGRVAIAVLDQLLADGVLSQENVSAAFDKLFSPAEPFEDGYTRID